MKQLERRVRQRRLWVWEHHGPVSMAFATPPVAGVSRITLVYTPSEHRRHGYASACVAELAARTLSAEAEQVILYTELENPTSNRVYRRIGFEPIEEVLSYRFGRPADRGAAA